MRQNPPIIFGRLVSTDEKGALITAGFVTDRLANRETYMAVFDHVQQIKADLEDENHANDPRLGLPDPDRLDHQARLRDPGLRRRHDRDDLPLLWLYFRRWHGVLIPAVAAMMTVIWGLGFTGWMGITFDPLILVIPMIITARAVSHTVQMAERFFEDYEVMLPALRRSDRRRRSRSPPSP